MAKQKINQNQISLVAFFVKATSTQNLSGGTFTKMTGLTTKLYDYGDNFNTSNQRFVAPVSGVYSFKGSIGAANDTTRIFATIYKNGIETARGSNGSYAADANVSQVVYEDFLNAGDYIELYAWRASNGNIQYSSYDGNGSLWLSGHLVGRA